MSDAGVRLTRQGHVAVLTLDRTERRNAMNEAMWDALDEAVAEVEADLPRALVLTGSGDDAFCAGFDVNPDNPMVARLMNSVQSGERGPAEILVRRCVTSVQRLVNLPIPTIAAVNGLAYGGGAELAVQCDMRVADPSAVFCFSEVKLGLMPDWGGGPQLARLLGSSRAAHLILTARKVGAAEALSLGMVNEISKAGASLTAALELADSIAANGPRAVRSALQVLRRSATLDPAEALELEIDLAAALIASGECVHGISAFMTRSQATFPDLDDE